MSGVEDDAPASAAAAAAPAPTAGAGAPAMSSDADADVELQHASQVSQVYGNRQKRLDKGLNFLSEAGTAPRTRESSSRNLDDTSEPPSPDARSDAPPEAPGPLTKVSLPPAAADPKAAAATKKQGTLMGVFVPCSQNILGVILFLRMSTIVAQAGVQMTLVVVGICCCCTFMTSLSLSAIATNGAIKGGGPYYLISRALGPEFGGAVGLCFYLGTTVAGAMYILGAVETLKLTFPGLVLIEGEVDECGVKDELNDYRVLGALILTVCTSVVAGGVKYVSMVSPIFFVPVIVSILCIWLGVFTASGRSGYFDDLAVSSDGEINITAHWDLDKTWGTDWTKSDGGCTNGVVTVLPDWTECFALFFPSVTGIMAGSNRSGDLRNAQHSIPLGTVAAVLMTSSLYLMSVVFFGAVAERDTLKSQALFTAEVALPKMVVQAGITLSTLGAGLQSLTGAPRLLQAIANDNLIPALHRFRGSGEPRKPLLLTFCICMGCIVGPGNLDAIAPLITMFFLLCYTAVNASVLIQDWLRTPNWRPRFRYYHPLTAALGLFLCLFIMFVSEVNRYDIIPLTCIILLGILYKYIEHRKVAAQWGDSMRGLRYQKARNALLELEKIGNVHTKNWRPQVLLFCKVGLDGVVAQPGLLAFVNQLKGARGVTIISTAVEGELIKSASTQMRIERKLRQQRDEQNIRGFTQVVMTEDISTALDSLLQTAGLGGLGPNTAIAAWPDRWAESLEGAKRMKQILVSARAFNMALILIKGANEWPESTQEFVQPIDVWWVVHDGGLLLLLSIILRKHRSWHRAPLRVFCVCHAEDDPQDLFGSISTFLYNMRIAAKLKVVQILDGQGLNDLLPTRGAAWDGAKPKYNKAIISRPLGTLQFGTTGDVFEASKDGGKAPPDGADVNEEVVQEVMTADDLEATAGMPSKLRTTLAFNHVIQKYSHDSALVMTNLPVPKDEDPVDSYMEHLAVLMNNIPRALLVAGQKDADVITMYS